MNSPMDPRNFELKLDSHRSVQELRNWEFLRSSQKRKWYRTPPDGSAPTVELPHSWNAHDTYQMGRRYYQGSGSYRTSFQWPASSVPSEDHHLSFLELGGFYGEADIWLNGKKMGRFDGQYLGTFLPLDNQILVESSTTLAIRLHNRFRRTLLPARKDPDFLLHGGLAGGARLWHLPRLHLDDRHKRLSWTVEEPCGEWAQAATLSLTIGVVNQRSKATEVHLRGDLLDPQGHRVGSARGAISQLRAGARESIGLTLRVENPQLWGPAHPHLYTLDLRLHDRESLEDAPRDRVNYSVGFREAQFNENGFFLNGQRLDLHGVNRHECLPGFGSALTDDLHRWDGDLLADLGVNCVRLAHYPHSPAFLDACDRLGLMVLPETASWKSVGAGAWLRSARRQWTGLIARDHHRPSIILWGMGNESRSRKAYKVLRAQVQNEDPLKRPVTYAENHYYRARRQRILGIPDVWGLNYELDELENGAAASRLGAVVVTECMNIALNPGEDLPQVRQLGLMEAERERIDSVPAAAGFFIWAYNDYPTEHRNRFRRGVGLFDAWRNPRPAADLFRSWFSPKPMVALWGDWSVPDHEEKESARTLHLFSNCEEIDLLRGEERVAQLRGKNHYTLTLPWSPEPLLAHGRSPQGDVRQRLEPWGQAVGFSLKVQTPEEREEQLIHQIHLRAIDEQDRHHRFYAGTAKVTLQGGGRLCGYTELNEVELTQGQGTTFLLRTRDDEVSILEVSGESMSPATITIP